MVVGDIAVELAIKPVSTHNKRISDFFSWRGMLVLLGTSAAASTAHLNFAASGDGQTGVWLGDVEDLWKPGKPRGRGGPWRETEVEAGQPSDPYLMRGLDKKRLKPIHECDEPATFHIEVDVLGAWQTPRQWVRYKTLTAEPGETIEHNFPRGFQAQWACLVPERATAAPATFIYE